MTVASLFSSGAVALLIVAVMIVEAFILRRHLRKMPLIVLGLGAGASLALALWAALSQQGWPLVAVFLLLSFAFHILEIRQWLSLAHRI